MNTFSLQRDHESSFVFVIDLILVHLNKELQEIKSFINEFLLQYVMWLF